MPSLKCHHILLVIHHAMSDPDRQPILPPGKHAVHRRIGKLGDVQFVTLIMMPYGKTMA